MSFAYEHGLRGARCNGCEYARLKYQLADKFLVLRDGWVNVYEKGAPPVAGQSIIEHEGKPIQHKGSFLSVGHSDECYHWKPPHQGKEAQ